MKFEFWKWKKFWLKILYQKVEFGIFATFFHRKISNSLKILYIFKSNYHYNKVKKTIRHFTEFVESSSCSSPRATGAMNERIVVFLMLLLGSGQTLLTRRSEKEIGIDLSRNYLSSKLSLMPHKDSRAYVCLEVSDSLTPCNFNR